MSIKHTLQATGLFDWMLFKGNPLIGLSLYDNNHYEYILNKTFCTQVSVIKSVTILQLEFITPKQNF